MRTTPETGKKEPIMESSGETVVPSTSHGGVVEHSASYDQSANTLPYERLDSAWIVAAVRLFDGEHLLVLQPFGWHLDGRHIPNAVEHFSREAVCEERGWTVACDYGPYIAVVKAESAKSVPHASVAVLSTQTPPQDSILSSLGDPRPQETRPTASPVSAETPRELSAKAVLLIELLRYTQHRRDCRWRPASVDDSGTGMEDMSQPILIPARPCSCGLHEATEALTTLIEADPRVPREGSTDDGVEVFAHIVVRDGKVVVEKPPESAPSSPLAVPREGEPEPEPYLVELAYTDPRTRLRSWKEAYQDAHQGNVKLCAEVDAMNDEIATLRDQLAALTRERDEAREEVQRAWAAHAGVLRRAEDAERERDVAMVVLMPNMPESGLVDACKQRMQAYISERDNADVAEKKLAVLRAQTLAEVREVVIRFVIPGHTVGMGIVNGILREIASLAEETPAAPQNGDPA